MGNKVYDENSLNAKKFVEVLAIEGRKRRCDDTSEFYRNMEIPDYYDERKFKRGQKFFHDHIFAMFYAKFLGLISDISEPEGREILKCTNKSSKPVTAFRRYVSTILHMCTWYSGDLKPGSRLWQSLIKVRNDHNRTNNMCEKKGMGVICQHHMAGAQFGFMGYALVRPKQVGIHNIIEEDREGFVHFWRVIGHLLGIEERFNICRDSITETENICEEIIIRLNPLIRERHPDFLLMAGALISGMWCMMPILNKNVSLRLLYEITRDEEKPEPKYPEQLEMSFLDMLNYYFCRLMLYMLKFEVLKILINYIMHVILYFTEKFPFLAYYRFGKINFNVKT